MVKKAETSGTVCPVARSTALIGDRWTILIMRELVAGCARFDDIQAQTDATPQLLTTRLKQMEADGLVVRRAYSERPLRYEYLLTDMGRAFYPVIFALRAWGETWCKTAEEPLAVHVFHRECGTEIGLDGICPSCKVLVARSDMESRPSPEWAEERRLRQEAHKARIAQRSQKPAAYS